MKKPVKKVEDVPIPEGLKQIDIDNPNNLQNLLVYSYLCWYRNYLLADIKSKLLLRYIGIEKSEQWVPPAKRALFLEIQKLKLALMKNLEDEVVSEDEYM